HARAVQWMAGRAQLAAHAGRRVSRSGRRMRDHRTRACVRERTERAGARLRLSPSTSGERRKSHAERSICRGGWNELSAQAIFWRSKRFTGRGDLSHNEALGDGEWFMAKSSVFGAIIGGGLAAGACDFVYANVFYYVWKQITPMQIWQSVASGLIGGDSAKA